MKRSRSRTLLAAALVATPAVAAGAEAEVPLLTLERAVAIAMEGSHRLLAADAGVAASEAEVDVAAAGRLPDLDLSVAFSRTTNPTLVFSNKLNQQAFTLQDFELDNLNDPDPWSNWQTALAVTYPVYTGGRRKHGIEAAQIGLESTSAGRERTRQEVVFEVIGSYTAALVAAARLDVAREALRTSRENLRLVNDLHEAGLVVRADLLRARVRESEVEELEIRAESSRRTTHAALNLALGRDLDTSFRLDPDVETGSLDDVTLQSLLADAEERRPDLAAAEHGVEAAERQVRISRGDRLPEVGVSGEYQANDRDFIGAEGTNWSVFAAARWRLFDGNAVRAKSRRAEHRAEQAARERDRLRDAIGLEVRRAYNDLEASLETRKRADLAEELARESLRTVQDRYREGLANLIDLLDAEAALTDAMSRQVEARRAVVMSEASLRLATGRL